MAKKTENAIRVIVEAAKDKTFVAKGVNPADLSVQGLPAVDNTEENNIVNTISNII